MDLLTTEQFKRAIYIDFEGEDSRKGCSLGCDAMVAHFISVI